MTKRLKLGSLVLGNTYRNPALVAKMAAGQIEKQMAGMAQKFIAGTTAADAISALKKIWKADLAFTLDLLGEASVSEAEAAAYQARYLALIEELSPRVEQWGGQGVSHRVFSRPGNGQLDRDHRRRHSGWR